MPDDPLTPGKGPGRDPEEELRRLFEQIERDEAASRPPSPPLEPVPQDEAAGEPEEPLVEWLKRHDPETAPERERIDAMFDEHEARLQEIEGRLQGMRERRMPEPPQIEFERKSAQSPRRDASGYLGLGVGLSVAYSIIGATLLGWGLGYLVDRGAGGVIGQAIGVILGAVVGLVAGILTIIRAQNKQG